MAFFQVKNLKKQFSKQVVWHNVNLSFPDHGFFLLLGESGCGKSTLLKCISGMCKFDEGNIYFQNQKIKDLNKFRKEHIAYIFQDYQLINYLSSEENVMLPLLCMNKRIPQAKEDVNKAIQEVGLKDKTKQKVCYLSGGQKQRIAIARAIVSQKEIILCDEITGALDKKCAKEILSIIKKISENHLVIVVSHDYQLVSLYADKVIKFQNKSLNYDEKEIDKEYEKNKTFQKRKYIIFNTIHFAKNNLKKGINRFIISIISLSLSISFLLIMISFCNISRAYLTLHQYDFFDYSLVKISKVEKIKIENSSLTLVQRKLPDEEDLKNNIRVDYTLHPDLEVIIPSYPIITYMDNEYDSIQFLPFTENSKRDFFHDTSGINNLSFQDVYLNKQAKKIFKNLSPIIFSSSVQTIYQNNQIVVQDQFQYDFSFHEVGVVEEFDYLNTPKVFYSQELMEEFLSRIKVDNLSKKLNTNISYLDRLKEYTYPNDDFSNYTYLLEIKRNEDVDKLFKLINHDEFEVNTSSYLIIEEFKLLYQTILLGMKCFMVISFTISFSLLIFILVSYVLSLKKEIGLYEILGLNAFQISFQFVGKAFIIYFFSALVSEIAKNIVILLSAFWIKKTDGIIIPKIFISSQEISLLFLLFICTCVMGFLPFYKIKKLEINQLIKEE